MLEKKPGAYIMIGNGGTEEGGCPCPFAALRFQRRDPDDRRGLLGEPGQLELGDAAWPCEPEKARRKVEG